MSNIDLSLLHCIIALFMFFYSILGFFFLPTALWCQTSKPCVVFADLLSYFEMSQSVFLRRLSFSFLNSFPTCLLLPFSCVSTLCISVSVALSPLLRCVGAGNVWKGQHKETKERREKSDTAIYRSVTSLLCIMLRFPGTAAQLHPPGGQCSQKWSILGVSFEKSGPGRRYTFSRPTRAASLWRGKGWTKAELAAGGRRKSQGCNPEQETCLSQQSKHRPSSAHSND